MIYTFKSAMITEIMCMWWCMLPVFTIIYYPLLSRRFIYPCPTIDLVI